MSDIDEQLDDALAQWGTGMIVPTTPDLAPRVRAALQAQERQPWWRRGLRRSGGTRLTLAAAFMCLAVLAGAALYITWQSTPREAVPSARILLVRAVKAGPAKGHILHLVYRVTAAHQPVRRLDIWTRYHDGAIVDLERFTGHNVRLRVTYVRSGRSVQRTWTSPRRLSTHKLRELINNVPVIHDGGAAAGAVLGRYPTIAQKPSRVTIAGRQAFRLSVPAAAGWPRLTLFFDAQNYTLVAERQRGYLQTLTSASSVPVRQASVTVVAGLRNGWQPPSSVADGVGAY